MTEKEAGWIVRGVAPPLTPGGPTLVEIFAVNIPDAAEAVAAVEKHGGLYEPPAETLCALPQELLHRLGLKEPGQIGVVRCEFSPSRPVR